MDNLKEKMLQAILNAHDKDIAMDNDNEVGDSDSIDDVLAAKQCAKVALQHTIEEFMWFFHLMNNSNPMKSALQQKIAELKDDLSSLDKI